ncbi:MAG: diaminopimelate epimerase, partial [Pseudomonadota bacterium]
ENCGNGARCFAKFVQDRQLAGKQTIKVETRNGQMVLNTLANGDVTVDMGVPELDPKAIPFDYNQQQVLYSLPLQHGPVDINAVSMGNPHAVLLVEDVNMADVKNLGPEIENHPFFPQGVNAGFMAIRSANEIDLRVFERGAGETLACGTGACAAVVAGRLRQLLDSRVKVNLPGGSLYIEWACEGQTLMMTGPAETSFHGQIQLT